MRHHVQDLVERHIGTGRFSGESNIMLRCPFHKGGEETKPSFSVNVDLGIFQCFAGETKVLTPDGAVEIRELAGRTAFVLVPSPELVRLTGVEWEGYWKEVEFKSFGKQKLWEVRLRRNGVTKVIRATEEHRWFTVGTQFEKAGVYAERREVITRDLVVGHRLAMLFPQKAVTRQLKPSSFGIAHGFVFGDGAHPTSRRTAGSVMLWGKKDRALIDYFPMCSPTKRTTEFGARGIWIGGLPLYFNDLPPMTESSSYLYGFLSGYFAADGCVGEKGYAAFASADRNTLEKVQAICTKVGIATYGIRHQTRLGKGKSPTRLYSLPIIGSSVSSDFFLLKEHRKRFVRFQYKVERRGWRVVDVKSSPDPAEEVFCAAVPGEHAFVLDGNILTGNCFTCKVSGNVIKLLKLLGLPDHVVDAETEGLKKELEDNRERLKWRKRKEWVTKDPFLAATVLPETLLRPYRFLHNKLLDAGFNQQWLEYMEVGFDRVHNRITYPIRDIYGNLAGISGGATVAGQYPKYKVYKGRWKDPASNRWNPSDYGEWFEERYPDYDFHNHHYLWNYDSVYPRLFFGREENPHIIIVEGFKACLWLLQNGWLNTVALMGSSISERQCSLLQRLSVNVILFLDQDAAGRKGTKLIGQVLRKQQPGVRVAHYPYADDCQPDDLTPAEVTASIQGSINYPHYIKELRS